MAASTREIKVGLFVFIALILLAVVVFSISDFYTAEPHYPLRVDFNFANGIVVGAPVRLSGVDVGEVRSVRVFREEATQQTRAELGIRVSREAKVEEDAVAYINTLGLIGEKYLEIIPGTAGARILKPSERLTGKDSIPAEQIMESGFRVAKQLEQTISSINAVVGDEATRNHLKEAIAHSSEASEKLTQLLDQTNALLAKIRQGEGPVGRLLMQDDLYNDLKELTADLKAHPWKLLHRPKESAKKK
jgi:phospholipid/cholesterol/gamma-HCH transport system substrate-binding protein